MSEFAQIRQITIEEMQRLEITDPDKAADVLLRRIQTEFSCERIYVPSPIHHRHDQIRRAIANGTTIEATARAFGVSTRTVRRAMGSG